MDDDVEATSQPDAVANWVSQAASTASESAEEAGIDAARHAAFIESCTLKSNQYNNARARDEAKMKANQAKLAAQGVEMEDLMEEQWAFTAAKEREAALAAVEPES